MTYEDICASNKMLYEAMEVLTVKIRAMVSSDHVAVIQDEIYENRMRWNRIRDLINSNLDKLEEIWMAEQINNYQNSQPYRPAERYKRPSGLRIENSPSREKMIIEQYKGNYNKSFKNIASFTGEHIAEVERVITKYIATKHGAIPA